jgi:uncharacterized membrane protein YsdA (DUF1294 family)/cold shock CspA family protein
MAEKGTIKTWNDNRGFGFITPDSGGEQIFVHIKDFSKYYKRPKINLEVTYTVSKDNRGRKRAINVETENGQNQRERNLSLPIIVSTTFIFIVVLSVLIHKIPLLVLGIYVVTSLITYVLYAKDKSAAQDGTWRTPESTLHFFSLIGGWPGALIAQSKLRHKSKKISFRIFYWVTVMANFSGFVWLFTPKGAETIDSLIIFYRNINWL